MLARILLTHLYNLITMQTFTHHSETNFTFLALIAVLIIVLGFCIKLYFSRFRAKESPNSILQKKFSSGVIDKYEFEKQNRLLQKDEDLKMKRFFLTRI